MPHPGKQLPRSSDMDDQNNKKWQEEISTGFDRLVAYATEVDKRRKNNSRHSFNMDSSNEFNIFESVSKMTKEYTGMDIQGEIIVGCMVALTVGILVTSCFIPSVREALEEFMQPLITTFQEAISEKLTEKQELVQKKLTANIKEL